MGHLGRFSEFNLMYKERKSISLKKKIPQFIFYFQQ